MGTAARSGARLSTKATHVKTYLRRALQWGSYGSEGWSSTALSNETRTQHRAVASPRTHYSIRTQTRFLSFEEARRYVRTFNFTCPREWRMWCQMGLLPGNIPSNPDRSYKGKGWVSWPDWLGYGRGKLTFEEARYFVQALKLGSTQEWNEWAKSSERPIDIPFRPDRTYKGNGWVSWPYWLGYGKSLPRSQFLSFENARKSVRTMKFGGKKEWDEWSSSLRPDDIPSRPDRFYKDKGWLGWPDWFGHA